VDEDAAPASVPGEDGASTMNGPWEADEINRRYAGRALHQQALEASWKRKRTRVVVVALLFALALLASPLVVAVAYGHSDVDQYGRVQHFDPFCCDGSDCKHTEDEELVDQPDGSVKHLPSGKLFPKSTHKPSSNARQYVCIYNGQPRCLYRRFGT
jgi:hypothetical protein